MLNVKKGDLVVVLMEVVAVHEGSMFPIMVKVRGHENGNPPSLTFTEHGQYMMGGEVVMRKVADE